MAQKTVSRPSAGGKRKKEALGIYKKNRIPLWFESNTAPSYGYLERVWGQAAEDRRKRKGFEI